MSERSSEMNDRSEARRNKERLIPALEAFTAELPQGRRQRELREITAALRLDHPADAKLRTRAARRWLPALTSGIDAPSAVMRVSDWIAHAANESQIRHRRQRILIYPTVVLFLALGVFIGLSRLVLAPFVEIFDEFGLRVPAVTASVLFAAEQCYDHPVRTTLVIVGAIAIVYGLATLWSSHALSSRLLGTFVAGNTGSVAAMASLVGSLADLLEAGVPLSEAIELAGRGSGHPHFQNVAKQLTRHLHQGHTSLAESPYAASLPGNVILAIQPADHASPNITLLRELAAIYRDRANERAEWMSGSLGAFAVLAVGVVVAIVVAALFAPLIELTTGLT